MKKLMLLFLLLCPMMMFGQVGVTQADTLALSLVMDGSGSITSTDWMKQLNGYANAITDANVVPQDGSVALNMIQFSTGVQQEIPFTLIDSAAAAAAFAAQITTPYITQMNSFTNISGGIDLGRDTLIGFNTPKSYDRWVIDVTTDGEWNRGYDPLTASTWAVNNTGVDAVNALGIGTGTAPDFAYGTGSFSMLVNDYDLFETALKDKIIREVHGVPEPATMLLLGSGLLGLAVFGRKKLLKK